MLSSRVFTPSTGLSSPDKFQYTHTPGLNLAQGSVLASSLWSQDPAAPVCLGSCIPANAMAPCQGARLLSSLVARCSIYWPPWHPHSAQVAKSASAVHSNQHQASLSGLGPLRSPTPSGSPREGFLPEVPVPFSPADHQRRSAKSEESRLSYFLPLSTLSKGVTGSGLCLPTEVSCHRPLNMGLSS